MRIGTRFIVDVEEEFSLPVFMSTFRSLQEDLPCGMRPYDAYDLSGRGTGKGNTKLRR